MDFTEREQKIKMIFDLLLQALLLIVVIFMFLFMYKIPQKYISKYRSRSSNSVTIQARRHFIAGAQHLSKSRSSPSAAKLAVEEAEKAIALDPRDAASHILKALGLEILGFETAAIESIDVALSPLAVKSLAEDERGDALYKRAELRLGVSREERVVEGAVSDLVESVKLKRENVKAFVLLGECYERMEMKEKAVEAYESAIRFDSDHKVAREALNRLGNS